MKENRITVRFTDEQIKTISEKAASAQMTPSAYIRAAAMRHKIVVVDGLREMVHEVRGIGRNLNQLTILANEGRLPSTAPPSLFSNHSTYHTFRLIKRMNSSFGTMIRLPMFIAGKPSLLTNS